MKILLIDPQAASREQIAGWLNRNGYTAFVADSIRAAIKYLRKDIPDAVVLDVDVFEAQTGGLVEGIQKRSDKIIPVIGMTNRRALAELEALFDIGVTSCLPRPFQMRQLIAKIQWSMRAVEEMVVEDRFHDEGVEMVLAAAKENGGVLGDMANVHAGIAVRQNRFRRGAPPTADWHAVLTGEVVQRFKVGIANQYVLFDRLALLRLPHASEYDVEEKVVVRRSDMPLCAALDRSRLPVYTGLYTIVPAKGLDCAYLTCLLNSRLMDFYFNRVRHTPAGNAGSFLRAVDLEAIPVVVPEKERQSTFKDYARQIMLAADPDAVGRQRLLSARAVREMNQEIFAIYGVKQEQVKRLAQLHF